MTITDDQWGLFLGCQQATLSCMSSEFGIHSVLVNYVPSPDRSRLFVLSRPSSRKVANIEQHHVASLLVSVGTSYASLSCTAHVDRSEELRHSVEQMFRARYGRPPRVADSRVILVLEPIKSHGQIQKDQR